MQNKIDPLSSVQLFKWGNGEKAVKPVEQDEKGEKGGWKE